MAISQRGFTVCWEVGHPCWLNHKQVKDWIHGVQWGHCWCWSAGTGDTERWCGPDRESWWPQIPWWLAKIIRWWFPAQSPPGLVGMQLDVAGMEVSYSIPSHSWDRLALQCRNGDDHTCPGETYWCHIHTAFAQGSRRFMATAHDKWRTLRQDTLRNASVTRTGQTDNGLIV